MEKIHLHPVEVQHYQLRGSQHLAWQEDDLEELRRKRLEKMKSNHSVGINSYQ